jgi:hypothetical protein
MKQYEERLDLEKRLRRAQMQYEDRLCQVENQNRNIAIIRKRHEMIEKEETDCLAHLNDDLEYYRIIKENCEKELGEFHSKHMPQILPEAQPIIEPLIELSPDTEEAKNNFMKKQIDLLNEDADVNIEGLKQCPVCQEYFTPGGAWKSHTKACLRKYLAKIDEENGGD